MKELYRNTEPMLPQMASLREISVAPMVYEREIAMRFSGAVETGIPLTIFVPWGVRPVGSFGSKDDRGLGDIVSFSANLRDAGIPNTVLLMPADVYAVEVNGMDPDVCGQYFETLTQNAQNYGCTVKPWSEIREENQQMYDSLSRSQLSPEVLWNNIPKAVWYRTIAPTALERNRGVTPQQALARGFAYLRERLAESTIVDRIYQPVKFSMVSPNKDDVVDNPLPRVYALPVNRRFPWL